MSIFANTELGGRFQTLPNYYKKCKTCDLELGSFLEGIVHFEKMHRQKRCPVCFLICALNSNHYKTHLTYVHIAKSFEALDLQVKCPICDKINDYRTMWYHISDNHIHSQVANDSNATPTHSAGIISSENVSNSCNAFSEPVKIKQEKDDDDTAVKHTRKRFTAQEIKVMLPYFLMNPNPPWKPRAEVIAKRHNMEEKRVATWLSYSRSGILKPKGDTYPAWALNEQGLLKFTVSFLQNGSLQLQEKPNSQAEVKELKPSKNIENYCSEDQKTPSSHTQVRENQYAHSGNYQLHSKDKDFLATSFQKGNDSKFKLNENYRYKNGYPNSRRYEPYPHRKTYGRHHYYEYTNKDRCSQRNYGRNNYQCTNPNQKFQRNSPNFGKWGYNPQNPISRKSASRRQRQKSLSGENKNYQTRQSEISLLSSDDLKIQFKESKPYIDVLQEHFYGHKSKNANQDDVIEQTKLLLPLLRTQLAFRNFQRKCVDECLENDRHYKNLYEKKNNFKLDIARHWAPILVYATRFKMQVDEAIQDFIQANKEMESPMTEFPNLETVKKMFMLVNK